MKNSSEQSPEERQADTIKEVDNNLGKWIIRQTRPCSKCIFEEKPYKKCEGCDDTHSLYMEKL